ncbi:MAG: hypothetical protein PF637_05885 [Spirochaetes bacterium]|jgi:hypothetical protein|nr:hypothetical protein [Spirochaetota bacterium]
MADYDRWLDKEIDFHMDKVEGEEKGEEEKENEDLGYIEYDSEYMSDMWFGKQ